MTARRRQPSRRIRGFTLIELMIALLLGMLVVAAAGAIFFSNRQTYVATESLSRVQETARTAFELMARDLREAGGNPCNRDAWMANVVSNPGTQWWTNWADNVLGYGSATPMPDLAFGSGPGQRVAATDAVEVKSAHRGITVVDHTPAIASFTVQNLANGLQAGDIALVCDYTQAAVFQVLSADATTVSHDVGGSPGNCTRGLGLPVSCGNPTGTVFPFPRNSTIAKVDAVRWYIGNNARGGTSLFRQTRRSAAAGVVEEEVVPGVTAMRLTYLIPGNEEYRPAAAIAPTAWSEVTSIHIAVDIVGDAAVGPGREQIQRTLAYVASIRNRNS